MWEFEFEAPYGDQCKKLGWAITTWGGENVWWSYDEKMWKDNCKGGDHTTHKRCRSFKAFQRHLRNHPELKGQKVILVSRYIGYSITANWVDA